MMVRKPAMNVSLRLLKLSQTLSTTPSCVKYHRMRWKSQTVRNEFLLSPGDVFSSGEDFEALRPRKRRRPLEALRNYVHSNSPTAHSSTSEVEIAIMASLNTAMAISCAVDEAIANSEASGGASAVESTTAQGSSGSCSNYHRNTCCSTCSQKNERQERMLLVFQPNWPPIGAKVSTKFGY